MRTKTLALVSALGLGLCTMSANASPLIQSPHSPEASGVIPVADGCGGGMHRNYRGHCIWNHGPHAYHGHYWHHPYSYHGGYSYYGGGYEPWNRPSPSDHIANQLNAQQAHRGWGY